jgi:Xaa-Pro aminopeptidase
MMSEISRRNFMAGTAASVVIGSMGGPAMAIRVQTAPAASATSQHDRLQPDWYRRKIQQVQGRMAERKLDALVLTHAPNVIYTTGYFHRPTERPLAVLIPKSGEPALFIPGLETDQVKDWWIKDFETYFDYPGPENRVRWIFERIARRGLSSGRIGIEDATSGKHKQIQLGAPHAELVIADDLIEHLRWVKDEDEIHLMQRAAYFADYACQAGREFIQRTGPVTEDQILKFSADALADKMSRELHDVVGIEIEGPFGGMVPFGKRSAYPHAVPSQEKLKRGDALILSYGAGVGGYAAESERAFVVGKPTDYARKLYEAMLAAHDTAAENLKEGAVAEEVDKKSLDQIRKAGFGDFLKHRTGHGVGLEGHESPWIAEGDKTVLKQGMTFSCEPGVYDPNFGGFRHSDTVVVGKDKGRILNTYPTRLEEMIIEI